MVVQVFQKMAFSIIVFFSKSIVFYHDQVENAVQIVSDVLPYDGNEAPELLEQKVAEGVLRRPGIEKFIINCAQLVQTRIAEQCKGCRNRKCPQFLADLSFNQERADYAHQ